MRGIEALLLLGFVGLVGIGLYSGRDWFSHAGGTVIGNAAPNASAVPGKGAEKSDAKATRTHSKRSATDGATQMAAVTTGDFPISTTVVQVPAPIFPTRKDLPIGVTGAKIREQYGEPTARVSEVRAGIMLEHYFYFNGDRTQVTVATLQHGAVVSVLSTLQ